MPAPITVWIGWYFVVMSAKQTSDWRKEVKYHVDQFVSNTVQVNDQVVKRVEWQSFHGITPWFNPSAFPYNRHIGPARLRTGWKVGSFYKPH